MQKNLKKYGFTLIEIMIAMTVLVVLTGIIITMVVQSGAKSQADLLKVKIFSGTVKSKLAQNITGDWIFSENTGNSLYDTSDYGNTATKTGGTWATGADCVTDSCLLFNGSSDYIDFNYAPAIGTGEFTIGCWFKSDVTADWQFLLNKQYTTGGRFDLYLSAAGTQLYYFVQGAGGTITNNITVENNKWYYIVLTREGGKIKLYLDGILASDVSDTAGDIALNGNYFFGRQANAAQRWFKGYLDDVSMYDDGMTISQLKENYLVGLDKLLTKGGVTEQEYNQRVAALEKQTASK